MKNTLLVFLTITLLLSGITSFAEKKPNDYLACPTATISYASIKFCNSDTNTQAVNLTGTDAYLGGTFTSMPSGLSLNPSTGSINSNTSTPGIYTVTYTIPAGTCPSSTVTTNIEIVAQPNAGSDGSTTICESSWVTINLFDLITGEQAGGTWTQISGAGGTFNAVAGTYTPAMGATSSTFFYTLAGTSPCIDNYSVAIVNINPQPNAGTDGGVTICDNSTVINLYDLITGEQAGGTWVRTSGTGGTLNAASGTYTPAVGATTSTFVYTLVGTMPCVNDMSVATVTIGSLATGISISGSTTTCAGTPVTLTVTGTPGTVINWTGTPSSFTIGASGSNVFAVSPTVNTTYTLTSASLNGCSFPVVGQSATVIVSPTPQFITQIPDITICNGGTLNIASQLTSTVPGATFIWSSSTGNVNTAAISGDETNIDQIVNLINPLANGSINIQVIPQIGSCSGTPQQIVVTVQPIPAIISTTANQTTICDNQFVTLTSNSNSATAYNWQINTASGVQIVGGTTIGTSTTGIVDLQLELTNWLVSGTISFDITPVNGICTGATITNAVTITVNPIPGTPIPLAINEICSGEMTNLTIMSYPNISGTTLEWTITDSQNVTGFTNGTGTAPFSIYDILTNTSNVQGFVKYSVTSKLGDCEGGTTDYIVHVNPLPKPILTDGNICVDPATGVAYQGYLLDTQLSNPNFTYDWFLLNTTTNMFDQIAGASASTYETIVAGSYQVIVTNTSTNCIDITFADVIEVVPATGISTTISEASTITVTVNPIGTGNLIYTLDNGAWQESNVFTGVEAGFHTVLVSDLEGCTNLSIEVVVNEELLDLVMYPNPTFDSLSFKNKNKVMSVQISNHIGQIVLTKDINLKNGTIDLSELNMGIYNIVFETENGTVNQRIIKQ